MKREHYVLRDNRGVMKAAVTTMEGADPEIEPWMAENIRSRGWSLRKFIPILAEDHNEDEIEIHGYVDWKAVAHSLAAALRPLLSDEHEVDNEEQAEEFLEQAQQALDAFDVAQMEAALDIVAQEPAPPEQEAEPDDG